MTQSHQTAPARSLVAVGSYADADQPGIYFFRFDAATGTLTARGSFAGVHNPSFLAVHPNRRWLYAVGETSRQDGAAGSVWALHLDRSSMAAQAFNYQPSGGDGPCHVQLDADGKWLLVSNYGSGTVAVLPILADGALGEPTDTVQHSGSSVNRDRQEGPHAHSTTLTPDQRFAITADLGTDHLMMYRFDRAVGKLTLHAEIRTQPGSGPRHMAFHPDGAQMYLANELTNTVTVYSYDAANGALHEQQTVDTLPADAPENTVADIHVAPDGRQVYVSNRGHNSIAVFNVEADGRLTRSAIASCGGNWPRHFTLAPDGRFMLVANQYSGDVAVLPLHAGADAIGAAVAHAVVPRASCVQWVDADD